MTDARLATIRARMELYAIRPMIKDLPVMVEDIAYLLERIQEAEAEAADLARLNQPPTIIQCGDPAGVVAFKLAEVTEQRDTARAKLAEAWGEGVDAALENPTQLVNPYLLPGEDGPR